MDPIRYEYVVRVSLAGYLDDMTGFLDMLRYEGSRVISHSREAQAVVVTLAGERPPVVDRWRSFGIFPVSKAGTPLDPTLAGLDAAVNL